MRDSLNNKPIGIYDSGCGGLTVLKALADYLPHESFVYLADHKHCPYGDKSPDEIRWYAKKTMEWMIDTHQVKLIVTACHTSSCLALESVDNMKTMPNIPIVGTIRPTADILKTKNERFRLGILATLASANSHMHEHVFREVGIDAEMMTVACPKFVPLIESGADNHALVHKACHDYLSHFRDFKPDHIFLGCTHYPMLINNMRPYLPQTTTFLDPAEHIAAQVRHMLTQTQEQAHTPDGRSFIYYSTDKTQVSRLQTHITDQCLPIKQARVDYAPLFDNASITA